MPRRRKAELLLLLAALGLGGCNDDIGDLQGFVAEVKQRPVPGIEPMPELRSFEHFRYEPGERRSPFAPPSPELLADNAASRNPDCLQPNTERVKEPLEQFPLDTLAMKGTLGSAGELWALISAGDGNLYRVTTGNYLGLYNGLIQEISRAGIKVRELVPDGAGCWQEREAALELVSE
ncbi:pilus assembly protein PilP [Gallaecimonas xiamenensis]|uniref:Type IV pilus biogenesis protein PilP n=1 Tax=Gallaecimonas xiamenensis 3-C-1 TaxID=745411 RepID=K2KIL3_9GAMM|nr:pilus assembly protein PilP [Gallaecimonas xiamenensis]EKE77090.1 type IV pilus biogenesis protein PilP [Gallaecimonas xiamenensis 3-C-1]